MSPQIFVWEQNLEQFQMDLFRYRCYLASLQGGELPNPKRLLAFASRPTKVAMGRLGIFSVSSFHALVSGRRPWERFAFMVPWEGLGQRVAVGPAFCPVSLWGRGVGRSSLTA